MFVLEDVRIPIEIKLEPGVYTCGNLSSNGKTRLLMLVKEYRIAGYPVMGYTYNDLLANTPFVIEEGTQVVVIDRYDMYKDKLVPEFDSYSGVVFVIDCKSECPALENAEECFIDMESNRITVWNV